MMRIVHRIPLIQAVVNKELQHLTQCFVVLRLLKKGGVSCVMKNNESPDQSKGQPARIA